MLLACLVTAYGKTERPYNRQRVIVLKDKVWKALLEPHTSLQMQKVSAYQKLHLVTRHKPHCETIHSSSRGQLPL